MSEKGATARRVRPTRRWQANPWEDATRSIRLHRLPSGSWMPTIRFSGRWYRVQEIDSGLTCWPNEALAVTACHEALVDAIHGDAARHRSRFRLDRTALAGGAR